MGTYDPNQDPSVIKFDEDAAKNGYLMVLSQQKQ
nr:hypothetical protein [Anaerostipes sp. 494a]